MALSSFVGKRCAMFAITLADSHFTRGAFSLRVSLTNFRQFSLAMAALVFVANSNASIQVALGESLAVCAKAISSSVFTFFIKI